MSKILVPTRNVEDWRFLLADPDKQWKRGYSAMATALCWEKAQGLPKEIESLLGGNAELLLAIPEHKVSLSGGRRESQCDVFALVRVGDQTCAVAVEAKVREPFGPTIGEWRRGESAGKIKRLTEICGLLGVRYPPPDPLRYQLFHRTAAAVIEARRFKTDCAAMIVHSFAKDHLWYDEFDAFCRLFGAPSGRGTRFEVVVPGDMRLLLGWATGESEFL